MRIKSLLRSVTIFTLLCFIAAYAAAQNIREPTGSASNGADTELMQYYLLFRRLVHPPVPRIRPSEPADQSNQTNQPRIDVRAMLHRSLKLSDTEARLLDQIAEDCISRTDKLDQQAQEIIAAYRAEVRAGKIPPTSPPPSALRDLQQQHDDAIRNAIEQLRGQFGAAEFKRLNESFSQNSAVSSVRLPPPYQKPLAVQVQFTLLNGDVSSHPQFSTKDSFTIEVSMLNNSTEMISIKPSQLYQWLLLTKTGEPDDPRRPVPRNFLFSNEWLHPPTDEAVVDLPPNQLQVVSRFKFGAGGIHIESTPGEYQLTVHPRVIYERPPKTDFLQLSLASPFQFEIVP